MGNTKYKKLYTVSAGSSSATENRVTSKQQPPSTTIETALSLTNAVPPSQVPVFDTHCHILSTYSNYRSKFPTGLHQTLAEFIHSLYASAWNQTSHSSSATSATERQTNNAKVEGIIDVWCEAPILWKQWEDIVDGVAQGEWGKVGYHFVMGVHPHHAKHYTKSVEALIVQASTHHLNVGIGEIGLDYHYDHSPRSIQQTVFRAQLQLAVRLGKPITIHSREANDDCWTILTEEVPQHWKIHLHCFTDSIDFAVKLLNYYPNLYFGITGVVTFTSNSNTRTLVQYLASHFSTTPLRILLETDSPYMIPSNLPLTQLGLQSGKRLPVSVSSMIPWTAAYVANLANEAVSKTSLTKRWTADQVMMEARDNARLMYGV